MQRCDKRSDSELLRDAVAPIATVRQRLARSPKRFKARSPRFTTISLSSETPSLAHLASSLQCSLWRMLRSTVNQARTHHLICHAAPVGEHG
jgi:hypothetical protein